MNKILLVHIPSSFRCEDTAVDKQPVNEDVVEAGLPKLDCRFLKQFSVFLRKLVI